jgi:hypothetical protein
MRSQNTGRQIPCRIKFVDFKWGRRSVSPNHIDRSFDNLPAAPQTNVQIYAPPEGRQVAMHRQISTVTYLQITSALGHMLWCRIHNLVLFDVNILPLGPSSVVNFLRGPLVMRSLSSARGIARRAFLHLSCYE